MKTEKEKMLAGELYRADDPELTRERIRVRRLLQRFNAELGIYDADTEGLYRQLLGEILPRAHPSIRIQPPFYCDYGYNIHCGENVFFNYDCVVLDVMPVSIGNNVLIAPKVQLYTATHPIDYRIRKSGPEYAKPIVIGDVCWIGGGSIICPGVTIGDRCIIGAGSVVTKDVPSDTIAGGNPAGIIRHTEP